MTSSVTPGSRRVIWVDPAAREALVDALVGDALAALALWRVWS